MPRESSCPGELLDKSAKLRLDYFKNYTMRHPLLVQPYEDLMNLIREPAGTQLIFVTGPTGVGKTTLRQRLEQNITEEMLSILETDPDRLPIVSIEAIGPDSGNWSWRDFYKRVLLASNEPLVDHKINPARYGDNLIQHNTGPRAVAAELRYAIEQTFHYRNPAAVFIDEAQHLTKTASGRKLQDQLDCLKSLANMTKTVHVLFGTYELLLFRNLSGQLSRRSRDIQFRRYNAGCEKDVESFQNVLRTFERHLPLKGHVNLVEHYEYLYERSIGCVGVLKDWLSRVLASVLDKGKESVGLRDLQDQALSVSQCEKMAIEAIEGEKELEEKEGSRAELQRRLHIKSDSITKKQSRINGNQENQQRVISESRKHRRVAEPKPKRYPVGSKEHGN